jgi:hypothetical protein
MIDMTVSSPRNFTDDRPLLGEAYSMSAVVIFV